MDEDEDMNCSYEADNPDDSIFDNLSMNESDLTCLNDSVLSSNASSLANDSFCTPLEDDGPVQPLPCSSSTPNKKRKKSSKKATRTSARNKGKSTTETNNNTVVDPIFKKPADPPVIFAKCPECRQGLKTERGFKNHLLNHKWKRLASKVPPQEEIRAYCNEEAPNILKKIGEFPWPGENGSKLCAFAKSVEEKVLSKEWETLFVIMRDIVMKSFSGFDITKRSITFPSTSRRLLIEHSNRALGDSDLRCHLFECLQSVSECSPEIGFPFLLDFIRKLGNAALAFYFRTLSGRTGPPGERRKRSRDDFRHELTHQVVHYIAGSCMKCMIRHSYTYYKCAKLQRRRMCIVKKFKRPDGSPVAQPREKSYWTQLLNRKSLFFVSDEAFPFFLEVAELLQKLEKPDGTLGHEDVMKIVVDTPTISLKWSMIVECELDEEESFSLMVKVIRSMTNTFGRGILLRRMNQLWKKGKGNKNSVGISHRAGLLTKK